MITVLCYPTCGTCRKAEKWLRDHKIEYNYRPIKEENPDYHELSVWVRNSHLSVTKFFNTSGLRYKELNIKDKVKNLSEDQLLRILATDGLLVKRPILVNGDNVLVGFKEEEWKDLFNVL